MSIQASELKLYGSAVMPDDDAAYVVESLVQALAEQRVATEA